MSCGVARLEVAEPIAREGWIRLSGTLTPPGGKPRTAWFEFESPDGWIPPRRARPFLMAFLPLAMRGGWTISSEDAVDDITLKNLAKWQALFAHWFPWSLSQVDMHFPRAEESPPRLAGAVMGFSGGVDSTDVLIRRRTNPQPGKNSLAAGVLIHGYDIPLTEKEAFAVRWSVAEKTLRRFGARGLRLRTNLRSLARRPYLDWSREVHGIWLVSALSCFDPWYGDLVVASSDTDQRLSLPWASNPITDPLLSGAQSRVTNEGGDLSRFVKIALLAEANALEELRVCYERPESGQNCGGCRKCLLLKLALDCLGFDSTAVFPGGFDQEFRRRFRTRISHLKDNLREMAAAADARGNSQLAREIRGMSTLHPWEAARDTLRRWVRELR